MTTTGSSRTLGLLPVRGGSLGLPGKNSKILGGKPLMAWAADALVNSALLDDVFCSTDSPDLAQIAELCGVPASPLRPAELAGPESLVIDTVHHVLKVFATTGKNFDQVVLVQATSPFVTPSDIENAIRGLEDPSVDSVVSVAKVPDDFHPSLMYRITDGGFSIAGDPGDTFRRRQDRKPWFRRVGVVLAFRVSSLVRYGALVGGNVRFLEVESARAVNIDTEVDFNYAEKIAEGYE